MRREKICKRCGGRFWQYTTKDEIPKGERVVRTQDIVTCPLCDGEYWKARYGTIGPLANPFSYKGMEIVEEAWKTLTEQRLGHAMPVREECK